MNDNGILNKQGYNSCFLPSQLHNLQEPARGPKKLHVTDMSLNYSILGLVNGQVSSSKSDEMGAISDKESDN